MASLSCFATCEESSLVAATRAKSAPDQFCNTAGATFGLKCWRVCHRSKDACSASHLGGVQNEKATDAKNSFGELMSIVEKGPVSITRNGRIIATVSPVRPDKILLSEKAIVTAGCKLIAMKELLSMYAKGLIERHDVQDETGLMHSNAFCRQHWQIEWSE